MKPQEVSLKLYKQDNDLFYAVLRCDGRDEAYRNLTENDVSFLMDGKVKQMVYKAKNQMPDNSNKKRNVKIYMSSAKGLEALATEASDIESVGVEYATLYYLLASYKDVYDESFYGSLCVCINKELGDDGNLFYNIYLVWDGEDEPEDSDWESTETLDNGELFLKLCVLQDNFVKTIHERFTVV